MAGRGRSDRKGMESTERKGAQINRDENEVKESNNNNRHNKEGGSAMMKKKV